MKSRLTLHEKLCEILGSRFVYFQPPASVRLSYPCIIYNLARPDLKRADNKIYLKTKCYDVTVIDKNPDSELPDKVLDSFEMISEDRHFFSDNLNHTVFVLYY